MTTPTPSTAKITLPNIFIVGPSGSGKTSSLRNLNPERTAILNCNRKALSFKGALKFKHHKIIYDYGELSRELSLGVGINPAIDVIAMDDFTSVDESVLDSCRKTEKGYSIYGKHNQIVREIIQSSLVLSETRTKSDGTVIPPKWIIWTGIDDIVNIAQPDGTNKSARRVKVEGRELAGWLETKFTVVLFTEVVKNPSSVVGYDYKFMTNGDGVTSAKTPMEMYRERFINNDAAMVIEDLKKYFEVPTI